MVMVPLYKTITPRFLSMTTTRRIGFSRYRTAHQHWQPLIAACLGTFLLLVYTSVVTAALPVIGTALGASYTALQWIVDSFTVALAGLLLACGAVSDALGRKRCYLVGLAVFTVATAACGLAVSVGMLIAARAVQGVAGAAMFATILPLVGLSYTGGDRARAFAVWGTVAGVASAVGIFAGGVIAQLLGWRWIFLCSLPICVVALVLGWVSLRTDQRRDTALDYPGMLSFSVAATALTYAVITGGDSGWGAPSALAGFLIAALAIAVFVRVERVGAAPILSPELFANRQLSGVLLVAFGYYFGTFGALPVLSLWLQSAGGLGPLAASCVLGTQMVVFILASSTLSARWQAVAPSRALGGSTVLIAVGCVCAATVFVVPSWAALLPALIITGFGAGIVSPIFPAVAMSSVPERLGGTAGAAANTARQLGLAWGVALCATMFGGHATTGVTDIAAPFLACAVVALISGIVGGLLLRHHRVARAATDAVAPHRDSRTSACNTAAVHPD
ncbi:MFS transporter [Nocardia callitridis]|uniref:MFS transporter n=1 Tax=Nocardia callitridis TaxID=648753 RepID=A0ABP9JQX8_9NOCA